MPGQQGQCCLNCQSGSKRGTRERYGRGTGEVLERYWRGTGEVLERLWRGSGEGFFGCFGGGLARHRKHLLENDKVRIMNAWLEA